jgi:hypothetical protein
VSTWQAVLTAALIGSERSVVPALPAPFPAQQLAPGADPAADLLDRAALLTVARRAGYLPDQATPPLAAPDDPRPAVGAAAAQRLDRILGGDPTASGGGAAGGGELLTEWLAAVVARGLRPPAQFLPVLLHRARQGGAGEAGLRRLIAVAGGPRALWLSALNPAWAGVTTEPAADPAQAPAPAPYLSATELAEVLARALQEITRAPLGAHRVIRQAGLRADPALGAPGALADFPPEAPNVLHSMLAVLRFRYEMLKELDDVDADPQG